MNTTRNIITSTVLLTVILVRVNISSARDASKSFQTSAGKTPLLSPNQTSLWRGEYKSFYDYNVDRSTGAPVAVKREGDPLVTTFELKETRCGSEQHVSVRPLQVADSHRTASFGRGMDFWDDAQERDVVVSLDEKVAQISSHFERSDLSPREVISPSRVLQFVSSSEAEDWANIFLSLSAGTDEARRIVAGAAQPLVSDDADLVGTRETARFPNLRSGDEPYTCSRDIYLSKKTAMLPVRVELRAGGRLRARCTLEWQSAATSGTAAATSGAVVTGYRLVAIKSESPVLTNGSSGEDGAVSTSVRYDLLDVAELSAEDVTRGLTPVIPAGYKVIDVDAMMTAHAASAATASQEAASADSYTLAAIVVSAATLVIVLFFIRRRLAART